MGILLMLLGGLMLCMRCGGSIAGEKRRKTWEDLLLTGRTLEEIAWSKMLGVLQAALPQTAPFEHPFHATTGFGVSVSFLGTDAARLFLQAPAAGQWEFVRPKTHDLKLFQLRHPGRDWSTECGQPAPRKCVA